MSDVSDRHIDIDTLGIILEKCTAYGVKLRKSDVQMINGLIAMHNPIYDSAKSKSRAIECGECIMRIFRVCVNLDGRARRDIKTLVAHLTYLSQYKTLPSKDITKIDKKIDNILKYYKNEEDKSLSDSGGKNTSSMAHNVRATLAYIDENITLLDACEAEKRAKEDSVLAQRIADTKRYYEDLRLRVAAMERMDGGFSSLATPHLNKIIELILKTRTDIYNGNFIANLSRNKDSAFVKIDLEAQQIESLVLPKGKAKQTYLDHISHTQDKTYQTYIDYPRKTAQYQEAKASIEGEIERLYQIVDDSSSSTEQLEEKQARLRQEIAELRKQKQNGEISFMAYNLRAQKLKTQWDCCVKGINIRATNASKYASAILKNLQTCSDAFNSIDAFIELASRDEFMSFIDRILKSIYSILAVLKTNNFGQNEVERIRDTVTEISKLQQENEYVAVVARTQMAHTLEGMFDGSQLDLDSDPLANLDEVDRDPLGIMPKTDVLGDIGTQAETPLVNKNPTDN